MLDFTGADAKCQRAEGAMRGGVAIAADYRHAGLRKAELGTDYVHDALAGLPCMPSSGMPNSRQLVSSCSTCLAAIVVDDGKRAVSGGDAVVGGGESQDPAGGL